MQCLAHVFGSGAADIVNRLDRNLAAIGLFVILATAFAVVTATRTGVIAGRSRAGPDGRPFGKPWPRPGWPSRGEAASSSCRTPLTASKTDGCGSGTKLFVGHISSVLCSEGFGDGVLQPFPA